MKIFLLIYFVSFNLLAKDKTALFEDSSLLNAALPVVNQDYFLIEYGFIVQKESKNYKYNAFVDVALFQESKRSNDNLKSGALGIKAGVMMPLGNYFPISLQLGGGIAKAVLHPNPILGKNDQAREKDNLFLAEAALVYKYKQYFSKLMYQKNNVDYFTKNLFLTIGITY